MQQKLKVQNMKIQKQSGFALIASLVILVVLTIAGVSASDMNSIQMIMARNHQYYTEAFNTAYAEIDAQIINVAVSDISAGVPESIANLTEEVPRDQLLLLSFPEDTLDLQKNRFTLLEGGCLALGESIGKVTCNQYEINTSVSVENSNIGSDQRQHFNYVLPNKAE